MKIAVLGASGMLGSMLVDYLSKRYQIVATTRNREHVRPMPNVEWRRLDAMGQDSVVIMDAISDCAWAINAIGLIKQNINDSNVLDSIYTNAVFPHKLAKVAEKLDCHVIQIATDCVFAGDKKDYIESNDHDALDIYGKTKSLGEVQSPNMYHLRCSLIGRELKTHKSLMDWFLGQLRGAVVEGYVNHIWNGVTTLHFAKMCEGIIVNKMKLPYLQHVIPMDSISKASLLRCLADQFGREDIIIKDVEAKPSIDRSLATTNPGMNWSLWRAAGYHDPPSIEQMIRELSACVKLR